MKFPNFDYADGCLNVNRLLIHYKLNFTNLLVYLLIYYFDPTFDL